MFLQHWKGTGSPRKRRNFAEATRRVNVRGTIEPFSFDSVCKALDIGSELLRSRLLMFTSRSADFGTPPRSELPALPTLSVVRVLIHFRA